MSKIIDEQIFDKRFYLEQNPDVAKSGADPLKHYIKHGWKEGRKASEVTLDDLSLMSQSELIRFYNRNIIENGQSKIFCIGANKTGTTSFEHAMREFGYSIAPQREAVLRYCSSEGGELNKFPEFCSKYQVFQDVPYSLGDNYKYFDHQFPGSKFILTVRDSAEQWYKSLIRFHSKMFDPGHIPPRPEILKASAHLEYVDMLSFICHTFNTPSCAPYDKDILIEHYLSRNNEIINYFKERPNDFLLINVAGNGAYQRLANYLDLFPLRNKFSHSNKTSEVDKTISTSSLDSHLKEDIKYTTEVVIPISITKGFFNQIRLAYYSMELAGFFDKGFRINVVYSGYSRKPLDSKHDTLKEVVDENGQEILAQFHDWVKDKLAIRMHHVPDSFINAQYPAAFAHCNYRFHIPLSDDCRSIILCDADTVFLKLFDPEELIGDSNAPVIAGHMIHVPPPSFDKNGERNQWTERSWHDLFKALKLPDNEISRNCSISNKGSGLQAPNYNFGFVILNPSMLNLLAFHYNSFYAKIDSLLSSPMNSQIAVTAVGVDNKAKFIDLPAEYNAANDNGHWLANRIEEDRVFVLHYLRENEFLRETFLSESKIQEFLHLSSEVTGTELLKKQVMKVLESYGSNVFN